MLKNVFWMFAAGSMPALFSFTTAGREIAASTQTFKETFFFVVQEWDAGNLECGGGVLGISVTVRKLGVS